jgi:CxxC-x17-CxxC domain-containing protein
MYQGNWKCSSCDGTITELPFQPRSESGLTCRTCWSKNNNKTSAPPADLTPSSEEVPHDIPEDAGLASEPMPADDGFDAVPVIPGEKPKFAGDWQCASCGGSITSLPFSPRDTSNLKCLDCFKASRG